MPTLSQEMASWLASGDAPLLTDEAEVLDASPQGGGSETLTALPEGGAVLDMEGRPSELNMDIDEHLSVSGGESAHLAQAADVKADVSPTVTPTSLLEAHALHSREEDASLKEESMLKGERLLKEERTPREGSEMEAESEEDVPIASFKKTLLEAKMREESPPLEEGEKGALDALAEAYFNEKTQPDAPTGELLSGMREGKRSRAFQSFVLSLTDELMLM